MFKEFFGFLRQISIVSDVFTTVGSFIAAYFIRLSILKIIPFGAPTELVDYWELVLVVIFLWWWIFSLQGAYTSGRFTSLSQEVKTTFKTVLFGTVILLSGAFLLKLDFPHFAPRSLVIIFGGVNFSLLALEKTAIYYLVDNLKKKGYHRKPVIIVGTGRKVRTFIDAVKHSSSEALEIVGLIDDEGGKVGDRSYGVPILGRFGDLKEVLHRHPVDEVIFAVPERKFEIGQMIGLCQEEGMTVSVMTDFPVNLKAHVSLRMVRSLPLLTFSRVPEKPWQLFLKRMIDIVISALGLIILSPLFLVIAALVKFTSPGRVFYEWRVIGFNKRRFKSWKFRTMVENADELRKDLWDENEVIGPTFKMRNDPRVTRVGRVLRKFSLDELPQLYSVLKGDMSLVGPRPNFMDEVNRFESWHRRKMSLKPGLTCLWQVSGRNEIRDFDERVRLELKYIDNWSLWLDLQILFKTVGVVLMGTGQ